jgi:O-antigen/teichoic acid export membrane protein
LAERVLRLTLGLAAGQAALGLVLAAPLVTALYGVGFEGSTRVMLALVWWGAFATINAMVSSLLFSANRQKTVTYQAGVCVAVSLVLNLLLIPRLGAVGAALALSGAEVAGTVFLGLSCFRIPLHPRATVLADASLRACVAAALAAVAVLLVTRWSPWAGVAVALPVYLLLLALLRGIHADDVRALRPAFRRSNG